MNGRRAIGARKGRVWRREGLNRSRHLPTFREMPLGRGFRLLVLALAVVLGRAGGTDHPVPVAQPLTIPSISAPRESLPAPVHNEATCAFCQAAMFAPCAPVPAGMSVGEQGLVYRAQPAPDARAPHATSHRTTSSRAPPTLRSV